MAILYDIIAHFGKKVNSLSLSLSRNRVNSVKLRGFTIVELLIVVVVIAILAAITIVSYNGIQQNAYNAKSIANADVYKKALLIYAAENGSYPMYPKNVACLGGGYPDKNGDGVGDCVVTTSGGVQASQVSIADDPLTAIIGGQPILGDGPYRQRPLPAANDQFFVTSQVRYMHRTDAQYNGVNNFADAAQSNGKDIALKECYEPLPSPSS